jgi:DNA-directed RNA polymerase specialized sigma24 family protein
MPDDDERKRIREKVLADVKTHAAIRKVLRLRGVPESEVDDVLQDVLEAAARAEGLPTGSEEEGRQYVVGIARYQAIDHAHEREARPDKVSFENLPASTPATGGASIEDRDLVRKAVGKAMAENPRKVEMYLRSELHGESHAQLAREQNISAGRARSYASQGGFTLRASIRALGGGVAVFLLVIGGVAFLRRAMEGNEVAKSPRQYAIEMRESARRECAKSAWRACAEELRRAAEADPDGDTPELRAMRRSAEEHAGLPPSGASSGPSPAQP